MKVKYLHIDSKTVFEVDEKLTYEEFIKLYPLGRSYTLYDGSLIPKRSTIGYSVFNSKFHIFIPSVKFEMEYTKLPMNSNRYINSILKIINKWKKS